MAVSDVAGATAKTVRPADPPAPSGRAGFGSTLRSEFTKIRSTRSTYWTLLALVMITIAIGAVGSFAAAHNVDGSGRYFDPTNRSLDGLYLGQLVIAALGGLTITSEYSTGMIRTSLTAMPRRGVVFAAKAVAFGVVAFGTGLVTSFGGPCCRSPGRTTSTNGCLPTPAARSSPPSRTPPTRPCRTISRRGQDSECSRCTPRSR